MSYHRPHFRVPIEPCFVVSYRQVLPILWFPSLSQNFAKASWKGAWCRSYHLRNQGMVPFYSWFTNDPLPTLGFLGTCGVPEVSNGARWISQTCRSNLDLRICRFECVTCFLYTIHSQSYTHTSLNICFCMRY